MANTAAVVTAAPTTPVQWRAHFILILGLVAGSSASILIRFAQNEGVPTLFIVAARLTLAALVITPLALRHSGRELHRLNPRVTLYAVVAGIWLAIHFILFMTALEHTTVLVVNVLAGSSPLIVALIEVFVLRTKLPNLVWVGLLVAIAGSVCIALGSGALAGSAELGDSPLLGIILSLGGAVASALYLITGRAVRRHIALMPYLWLLFTSASLTSILAIIVTRTPVSGYSAEGYFWVLMVTIFPQLIGHSSFNYVLAFLPATFISISTQLSIVFTALVAARLFSETLTPGQVIGSAAILAGVIITTLSRAQKPESPGTPQQHEA